ncbi:deoxyribose-phosphate aldolase [Entomoplasma ellychniae]|uniref:Deoxyribose-phosphate aldolase n=1 Tax=Entomoplasma ellychniae TaxID=2114 RepID=A0A8E2QXY9_9MOLU|nr:deoxyribose-phosphate aldolase [Entomoplasma ellychniae]PPE04918.1 deoxyribose-phosphate aldolase [Entomoplasma ellychniae]
MNLNKYIDHTLLKADATKAEIKKLCEEAIKYEFATICVNTTWTQYANELLKNSKAEITNVIGFPLGACDSNTKAFETKQAIKFGASEIDMVLNIGALKDQNYELVLNDMKAVKQAAGKNIVKCIMENCLLTKEQIIKACQLAIEAELDFVKTSTGFSTSGATIEDVKLMKKIVGNACKVKAAGGVRTYHDAIAMINAGADRLGTSGGVNIVNGKEHTNGY